MKKAFTLVELLVVIAMIAVLMAAFTSAVEKARRRARTARATQEIKEMTNAILAYEQYAPGRTLKSVANSGWTPCSEGAMAMILGGTKGESGENVPVLYNGHVTRGMLLDPWGHPYQYLIKRVEDAKADNGSQGVSFKAASMLPNANRLTADERRVLK